jgi:transmembrane sensor
VNWEILLKYINNEHDALEGLEVKEWLNEQKEHHEVLAYLQKRKQQLQQPLKQNDIHDQWVLLLDRIFENPAKAAQPKSIGPFWLMGIAASFLLVSLLGWFYYQHGKQAEQWLTFTTPANMRAHISLPDGTQVFIAPDSKIRYNSTFNGDKREVYLSGEAFFNVKHNARKTFIIHTQNNLAVAVLGTSFNVYARKAHNTEVKVASGLVGITYNKQAWFLKAGEQLNCRFNPQQVVLNKVAYNDAAALQNETLFFKDNNADEIAEKLQRWYNVKVDVQPSARSHPRFSGEMKDTGINNLMQGLTYATGLNYRYTNLHTILLF